MRFGHYAYKEKFFEVCYMQFVACICDLVLKGDQLLMVDSLVATSRVMHGLLWCCLQNYSKW